MSQPIITSGKVTKIKVNPISMMLEELWIDGQKVQLAEETKKVTKEVKVEKADTEKEVTEKK